MRTINYAKALELADKAIALRGENHLYRRPIRGGGCYNIHEIELPDGSSVREMGCIVGTIAVLDGWFTLDQCPVMGSFGDLRAKLSDRISFTGKAVAFFEAIQHHQDNGETWGKSKELAVANVDLRIWSEGETYLSHKPADEAAEDGDDDE